MASSEDTIKESKQKLDSLIVEINEMAGSITEATFPNPAEIIYVTERLKRSKEAFYYPSNESSFLIVEIWRQYWFAAFSQNPQLIQFIKERLKLTDAEDWFFNVNDIMNEFDRINASGNFVIDSYSTLVNIYNYVGIKIFSLLLRKYVKERNGEPLSIDRIRNDIDTANYAKRKGRIPIQNKDTAASEKVLELAAEAFKETNSSKDKFRILQSFAKGTCEALYLPQIYNEYLAGNGKYYEGEKPLVVFNLFRLIIKDRFLKDEETYSATNSTFTSYNAYRKDAVKKILKLK